MKKHPDTALNDKSLYAKSQLYISRALRGKEKKQNDEYQLWATLALELLAKSTLSSIHPALIADPEHSDSLFMACGRPVSPNVKTITAKTLFQRLGRLDPKFDHRTKSFCEQQALRRNEEIHSGSSPFLGNKLTVWEGQYWLAVNFLLEYQTLKLEDWLSPKDVSPALIIVKHASQAIESMVKQKIKEAKRNFKDKYKTDDLKVQQTTASENFVADSFSDKLGQWITEYELVKCPACACHGVAGGEVYDEDLVDTDHGEDYYMETVEIIYNVEEFYCPSCRLQLQGNRELQHSDVVTTFTRIVEREREFEPDYGND